MIDFSLDEDQQAMVALARDFGRRQLHDAELAVDRMANPAEAFASPDYRDTMAAAFELGIHKLTVPERFGGLGIDPVTAGLVWEELARHGVGFAAGLLAGAVVPGLVAFLGADNERLVDRFVRPFCEDTTGTWLTGWGSSEPDVGSDGKNYDDRSVHHRVRARRVAGGYVLNGEKSAFVSNGGVAKAIVVAACVDPEQGLRGSGMFVLETDAEGLHQAPPQDRLGLRALNQAVVSFDDVFVPDDQLLFPPSDAYPALHHAIVTVGNLGTGYLAVGLMRAAYDLALDYARERVQWGRPIIEHQLVAKRLFETRAAIELSRALLWKGSCRSRDAFPGDLLTSLTAKISATNFALEHTVKMAQVLGAYGITRDYPLEKLVRDAPLLTIMDGTNDTLLLEAMTHLPPSDGS
jgi:alkylation response protein AidB-like acyl-CoA dehydrogenase